MPPNQPSAPRLTQAERVERSSAALIQAAVELIAEQGYVATTPAQISERAGYTRGMVRVRYGSKLDLLEAVLRRRFEERLLAPTLNQSLSGLDRVLGIVDGLRELLAEDEAFLRAVFMISFEALGGARELGPHFQRWIDECEAAVTRSLLAGQADGSVDAGLDCEAEGRHWAATGVGLVFRWCQDPAGYDCDAALLEWRGRLTRLCASR